MKSNQVSLIIFRSQIDHAPIQIIAERGTSGTRMSEITKWFLNNGGDRRRDFCAWIDSESFGDIVEETLEINPALKVESMTDFC